VKANKAIQTDKLNLSRLLLAQQARQLSFASDLRRYVFMRDWRGQ